MTLLPPSDDAFTKYYQEYMKQLGGTQSQLQPIQPLDVGRPGGGERLGVLGRTIDILSRPLRIISNPVMKALELPIKLDEIKARETAGEVVPFSEKLGTVVEYSAPVAAAKGFFSDDPENKPYWSDIIEQASDTVNRNNPAYKDVEDNVNPVVKGVAGFVGDVALDPLTWVPAAWIAKGLQVGGRATQAVGKALKAVPGVSSKPAAEVAEDIAKVVDDVAPAQATQKATNVIADAIKAGDTPPSAFVSGLRQAVNDKKFGAAKTAPFLTTKISKTLQGLQKALDVDVPTGAPVPGKAITREEWDASLIESAIKEPQVAEQITFTPVTYYGETFGNLAEAIVKLSPKRLDGFVSKYGPEIREQQSARFTQFIEQVAKDKRVDILGRLPERRAVTGATAAVMRLANMAKVEMDNAKVVLGEPLLNSLRQMDDARFAEFMDNIQPVLERTGVVEAMGVIKANSAENKLLKRFNISKPQYDAAVADMEQRIAALIRGDLPKSVTQAIDDMPTDQSLLQYVDALIRQLISPRPGMISYNAEAIREDIIKAIMQAGYKSLSKFDQKALAKEYPWLKEKGGLLIVKSEEALGQGTAIITNKYETFAQSNAWGSLSEFFNKLITGVPKLDAQGNWMRGPNDEYLFEELPAQYARVMRRGNEESALGFDRAAIVEDLVVNTSGILDDFLSAKGLAITLDLPTQAGRITKAIRYNDVYRVLRQSMPGRQYRWLQLTHFNAGSGVARDAFADAFMTMMAGGTREEMLEAIRRGTTRWGNRPNTNKLTPNSKGKFAELEFGFRPYGKGKKPAPLDEGMRWKLKTVEGNKRGWAAMWDMGVAGERLVDAMLANRSVFDEIIEIRESLYKARNVLDFETVAPSVGRSLLNMFTNPTRQGEGILAVSNIGKMIGDYIKGVDAGEMGALYSALAVETAIPSTVRLAAQSAEDIATAMSKGVPDDVQKARQKAARADQNEATNIKEEGTKATREILDNPNNFDYDSRQAAEAVEEFNLSDPVPGLPGDGATRMSVQRIIAPLNGKYRMDARDHVTAYHQFIALGINARKFAKDFRRRLDKLNQYTTLPDGRTGVLEMAIKTLQDGIRLEDIQDPLIRAARTDIEDILGRIIDVSGDLRKTIIGTAFGRAGATIPKLQKLMQKHAVLGRNADNTAKMPEAGEFFDMNKIASDRARLTIDTGRPVDEMTAALEQWRDWPITNVRQFLAGMNAAMFDLANETAFIDNFFTYFNKIGFATTKASVAKQNGFVKVVSEGYSHFGDMLPNNFYLAPEAAEILQAMDQALRTTKSLTSPFGEFVMKTLDPITQTWKYTVTVIRLGHHIRNEIGSQSMRFFALGISNFAKAERLAYRVMGLRKNYTDVDILRGIQANGDTVMNGGESVVSFKFGKKSESLNADQIHLLLERYLFDTGATVEDLFEELGKENFAKLVENAGAIATFGLGRRGGGLERAAFGVSEFVEHKARAAHFIQALLQMSEGKAITRGIGVVSKPKNLNEAIQFAIESATKYHPNASTLSPYEMRYGRRTFPFYSWVKQASLALVEASVMHPARTWLALPKASYNIAIAAGVDPNSLADPFPEDQLFPSYLRDDMLGPQFEIGGRYLSVNPGFASADVFNDLVANPVEGVVGMVNPAFRIPLELLAGSRLGSQAPIRDLSDYIDSSIPGVNYASNITGRSISTLGLQEQAKVESGAKTGFDQFLSAFNWATGLGVRNYSRPDFINYAEIEERNRVAEERENR